MTRVVEAASAHHRQAIWETAATALWLLMELFWLIEWIASATFAGLLSLTGWLIAFRYVPRTVPDLAVNGAVVLWLVMNILWMLGEEFRQGLLLRGALVSVILSFVLLGLAVSRSEWRATVIEMFRRLRFRRS